MPTSTWENLDAAKRDRILTAAMREFGDHGFSSGSLNVIAREAGVAKGSLFQYFADKLEIYATVCEVVSGQVRDELVGRMEQLPERLEIFELIEWLMGQWVDYFAGHPVERGVTAATNLEIDPAVREAVRGVAHRHYLQVLEPLLVEAGRRGELAPGGDSDALAAYLLLLFPHLAIAPWLPGLDPVLGLHGKDPAALRLDIARLVVPLRAAFGS